MYRKVILILFLFSSLVMVGFRLGDAAQNGQAPVFTDHVDNFALVFPEISQESREWYAGQVSLHLFATDTIQVRNVVLVSFSLGVPPSRATPMVRRGFIRLARDSVAA